ncbi:response regulator transcription factor [Pseudomonas sp. R5(2019)]|uniref:response regulator transcription factor n=1 Tax=Pseudomonas sp. R5(2019) TaxID=2697566 RepID=UPI001411D549|nr:response regulator transcription factor [Pseudomonas sp. R5(2019)]NBA97326.1 response regulator [Pseudomonas sp. R5(2019)]
MRHTLVIADDHPAMAWAAGQLLNQQTAPAFEVVAKVHSTDELHRQLAIQPCDLLLTDFCMPRGQQPDGLAMVGWLRRRYPNMAIVVMTMLNTPSTLRALHKLGVQGLFDKHARLETLAQAMCSVARGRFYLSEGFARVLETDARPLKWEQAELSPREQEVMRLIGQGLSGRDIARKLNRSEKTISRHKRTAMDKLGDAYPSSASHKR